MLHQHLLSAAVSTCLTSPRLHDRLHGVLMHGTDLSVKATQQQFHAECQEILCDALDREEPRRFRVEDIGQVVRVLWPTNMFLKPEGRTVPFFDALSTQLFERTGQVLHFRADALDDYTRLSARIDPTLLLCWQIGREIETRTLSTPAAVIAAIEAVQPFCTPLPHSALMHSDNHVHFGGASSEQLILMSALRGTSAGVDTRKVEHTGQLQTIGHLAQLLLNAGDNLVTSEAEITERCQAALTLRRFISPSPRINWRFLRRSTEHAAPHELRWYKHQLALCMCKHDLTQAWLWLLLWCFRQYQDRKCGPKRRVALFLLLGTMMRFRQSMLNEGYGLSRFFDASNNRRVLDDISVAEGKDAAHRIFHGRVDRAEIKIAPVELTAPKVRAMLRNLAFEPPPANSSALGASIHAISRWHYCLNFSRSQSSPWNVAKKVKDLLASLGHWHGNPLLGARHWSDRVTLHPARLIRTIDVVGDENERKIEVFAPALRWLRSLPRPAGECKHLQLSIHAGEDYAHPLSGMRHLDETVRFAEMVAGDRIGHGLAIGVKPKAWFDEHGQALVALDDHVDNLVWAWHFAKTHRELPNAVDIEKRYEAAVQEFMGELTWMRYPKPDVGSFSMQELHDAWVLRRNCREHALQPNPMDAKERIAVPDWQALSGNDADAAAPVRAFRRRIESFELNKIDEYTKQKKWAHYMVQQTMSTRDEVPKPHRHDGLRLFTCSVTRMEIDFMEGLQDLLIEQYRALGLVFETNPTSNRHIGSFSDLKDHPIFRWDPPSAAWLRTGREANRFGLRTGPLRVCVNTDDPGVMPTTLQTEFALLREAALDLGFKQSDIAAWLDRLRASGNEVFDAAHPDLATPGGLFPVSPPRPGRTIDELRRDWTGTTPAVPNRAPAPGPSTR